MTEQEQKAFDAMREALDALTFTIEYEFLLHDDQRKAWELGVQALTAANAVSHPQATEPAWRPIESAPKDGTMVLCWVSAVQHGETDEGQQFQRDISQIDFGSWEDGLDGNGYFDPYCGQIGDQQHVTHWMPLPAAPEAP